jgi:D-tyrosyl-tRNA(Tyr) deacylase
MVDGESVASIGRGLLILVGIAESDDEAKARRVALKCAEMRLFPDQAGRFDQSVLDIGGEVLVVSQFTLLADVRKGRRPAFIEAAAPEMAEPLCATFAEELRTRGLKVATGRFGAKMVVDLANDGPVTIVVDSDALERPR